MSGRGVKLRQQLDRLGNAYVDFVLSYPWIVILIIGTASIAMSFSGIYFRLNAISIEPQTGFETRGTALSKQILTMNKVDATEDVSSLHSGRRKRTAPDTYSHPCQQYSATGWLPYNAHAIFQVDSFNALFTRQAMLELCEVDRITETFNETYGHYFTNPFAWNIADYSLCGNQSSAKKTCFDLEQDDVDRLKEVILRCSKNRRGGECSVTIVTQLLQLLPDELSHWTNSPESGPMFVAVFLPIYMYYGEGYFYLPSTAYTDLLQRFEKLNSKLKNIRLKGLNFNFKQIFFQIAVRDDIKWTILAVVLVVAMIFVVSQSIFFTLVVVASLMMAIGDAYFVNTIVFDIHFFPFTNLLVFVLLVGIGADNTFLLHYFYKAAKKDVAQSKKQPSELAKNAMAVALRHAAVAMFITSATTAAAFYASLTSNIIVLRCFGVFAGTTMLINYIFVISWLPASLIILDSTVVPIYSRLFIFKSSWRAVFSSLSAMLSSTVSRILTEYLPLAIIKFRFFWISAFLAQTVVGAYVIIFYPGLKLPGNNPNQLFRNSHPFEWYDEHAVDYFDFAKVFKGDSSFKINVIWGWKPVGDASFFDPKITGTLHRDDLFLIKSFAEFAKLERLLTAIQNSSLVDQSASRELWLPGFLEWSKNQSCSEFLDNVGGTSNNGTAKNCLKEYSQRHPAQIRADRPILDKDTGELIGYRLQLFSSFNQSLIYKNMKLFFDNLDREMKHLIGSTSVALQRGICVGDGQITGYFDLLENLLNGTPISVLISIGVALIVVVASTRHIRMSILAIVTIGGTVSATAATVVLLGWRISVVEATVITLTIGLSFDFTLHYAIACKMTSTMDHRDRRLRMAMSAIGLPVLLSALTTFVAGLAIIWSTTLAFYEIGVFMLLVTVYSYIFATFVFTSFVYVFSFFCENEITRL